MEIAEQVALAPFTTLGIGGPARFFAEVRGEDEARQAILWARERHLPLLILGGGSNVVIADAGFPGLVLHVAVQGIQREEGDQERVHPNEPEFVGGSVVYRVGAGVVWDEFVALAVAEGCAGIECLSGIPGSVGGTPVQNVGAYGQEVGESIHAVWALDLESLALRRFSNAECGFAYRRSRFNGIDRGRYLILEVAFGLRPGGEPSLRYADLKQHFAAQPQPPALAEVREAVLAIRRRKGMVVESSEPESRSAGSFFKNPVLSREQYRQLAARCPELDVPSFEGADGALKVPAAWLVEHASFCKGFQLGPVGISRKHALALVNRGGAAAADLLRLQHLIQDRVRESFGIDLEPEPVFIGF